MMMNARGNFQFNFNSIFNFKFQFMSGYRTLFALQVYFRNVVPVLAYCKCIRNMNLMPC